MNKFILYHHKSRRFAEYINDYSCLKDKVSAMTAEVEIKYMPDNSNEKFAMLPDELRNLLFFAKPDLVICYDDGISPIRPIFAFEVTHCRPARDHWLQRFNNLVGCAQIGVPGAYVIPFDLSSHPKFSAKLDSAFFYAYDRVMEIHQTPFYIAEWESDDKVVLNCDLVYLDLPNHESIAMERTFTFLNKVIDIAISGIPNSILMTSRLILDLRNDMRTRAYHPVPKISDYKRLVKNKPSDGVLNDKQLEAWFSSKGLSFPIDLPDRIKKRDKNLIFTPIIDARGKSVSEQREALKKRINDRGGDPYLGQPLAFDYLFCRLGKTPYERDVNLIIDLSILSFADLAHYHEKVWQKCPLKETKLTEIKSIPQYTMHLTEGCAKVMKNFLRAYAFAADIIVFNDGMVYF